MNRTTIESDITITLYTVATKLGEADQIARAPSARTTADGGAKGVSASRHTEQLLYMPGWLQDATSLLNRLSKD